MRRSHVLLPTLLLLTAALSAQNPGVIKGSSTPGVIEVIESPARFAVERAVPPPPPLAVPEGKATADDIAARLMLFDRDRDGRVANDELMERMQILMTLGDRNVDGVLDENEIRAVATSPQTPRTFRGFPGPGGYSFSDESGASSRFHFEGAVEDLRLASAAREQALTVVRTFVDSIEASATANLLKEMETMLTPAQLAEFRVALSRQSRMLTVKKSSDSAPQVVFIGTDLGRFIQKFNLRPEQSRQALAAIEQFKTEFRPDAAEKSALVDQMKDILSVEERADFRAAIDRRPLTKGGFVGLEGGISVGVTGGVVGGTFGGGVVGGLVSAPAPRPMTR